MRVQGKDWLKFLPELVGDLVTVKKAKNKNPNPEVIHC